MSSKKRISFASTEKILDYPDFLEVQLKSFQDFFQLETTPNKEKKKDYIRFLKKIFPFPIPEITLYWNL